MLVRLAVVIWWIGFACGVIALGCLVVGTGGALLFGQGLDFFLDALGGTLVYSVAAIAALSITYVLGGTFLRPPKMKNS